MKKNLMSGLAILLPLALAVWILLYLLDLFTAPVYALIEHYLLSYEEAHGLSPLHHKALITTLSRTAALVLTLLAIFLLGLLARKYFFGQVITSFNKLIIKIPVFGSIYKLTKDITKAMLSTEKKTFKETVLIPFPNSESYTLAFLTGEAPEAVQRALPGADAVVFVPTAPHPISGYLLFTAKKNLKSVDISTEESFKFLLSCGSAVPKK